LAQNISLIIIDYLYAITNSKFTGSETEKDWNQILEKLKSLNLEKTLNIENDE
jgi:hypothetical protein